MARSVDEIEAALDVAGAAWRDAVEAHRAAVTEADGFRRRAIAGDAKVTANALAVADDFARFAELGIAAKKQAVQVLEAEHRVAQAEAFADEVSETISPLGDRVESVFAEIEAALDNLVESWRRHAAAIQAAAAAVGTTVSDDVTPRVRRGPRGVVVDGLSLRPVAVHERVERLAKRTHERLFSAHAQF